MRAVLGVLLFAVPLGCADEGGEGGEGGDEGGGGEDGGAGETGVMSGNCDASNEDCTRSTCGGESSTMLPGADCLGCHTGGEGGRFTIGGTVFTDVDGNGHADDVTVTIHDANDQMLTLTSNSAGNFYSSQSISFPITAEIEKDGFTTAMTTAVTTAACNSCHQCDGAAGGKLYAP